MAPSAGKNLKPYQGLKLQPCGCERRLFSRRKKPKTLSGIETGRRYFMGLRLVMLRRKKPKTLSGIETIPRMLVSASAIISAGKNLKPYQGLKLQSQSVYLIVLPSRKKPKTLSGIETRQQRGELARRFEPEKT